VKNAGCQVAEGNFVQWRLILMGKGKGCSCEEALKDPWGSGRSRLRIYVTFSTMNAVRSSFLRTGRLYPREFLYNLVLRAHGSVGASEKSPATPPVIDPETLRLVAQRLNHYATPGPIIFVGPKYEISFTSPFRILEVVSGFLKNLCTPVLIGIRTQDPKNQYRLTWRFMDLCDRHVCCKMFGC
jgi:hypothetical protein